MAITAVKAQKCWRCKGGISPGDPILPQRGWVHESCYVPKPSGQQFLPGMGLLEAKKRSKGEKK